MVGGGKKKKMIAGIGILLIFNMIKLLSYFETSNFFFFQSDRLM